jgi:hypothetical protein
MLHRTDAHTCCATEQSESPVLSHRLQPREEVNGFNEQQRTLLVFCAPAAAESLAEVIDEAAGAAGCEAASLDRRAAVPMLELREALIFSLVEHLSAREWVTLALEDRLTFLRRGSGTCPQAMIELSVSEDAIVISISVKLQRVAPFDVRQVNLAYPGTTPRPSLPASRNALLRSRACSTRRSAGRASSAVATWHATATRTNSRKSECCLTCASSA